MSRSQSKTLVASVVVLGALAVGGCASPLPVGGLYTAVNLPVSAGEGTSSSKVGTALCQSVLGMVAWGDCSLEAAMNNGGIKRVRYVDWQAKNILGVYGEYTTKVYGD